MSALGAARARRASRWGADRSVAALTIHDMPALDKTMVIGNIRPLEKRGGKSRLAAQDAKRPVEEHDADHGEVVHTAQEALGAAEVPLPEGATLDDLRRLRAKAG